MKKLIILSMVLCSLFMFLHDALADSAVVLSNTNVSVLTLTDDEWQGDENYWLVQVHTGINTSRDYKLIIPNGFVAIVECFKLNKVEDGHLVAYDENQTVYVTVQNGFVGLCTEVVAESLFTERWHVLRDNNWARKDIQPLPEWNWIAD